MSNPNKGVPNLDDMDIGDMFTTGAVFMDLSRYCLYRRMAFQKRQEGEIQQALSAEANMQSIYGRLPHWAKW